MKKSNIQILIIGFIYLIIDIYLGELLFLKVAGLFFGLIFVYIATLNYFDNKYKSFRAFWFPSYNPEHNYLLGAVIVSSGLRFFCHHDLIIIAAGIFIGVHFLVEL